MSTNRTTAQTVGNIFGSLVALGITIAAESEAERTRQEDANRLASLPLTTRIASKAAGLPNGKQLSLGRWLYEEFWFSPRIRANDLRRVSTSGAFTGDLVEARRNLVNCLSSLNDDELTKVELYIDLMGGAR